MLLFRIALAFISTTLILSCTHDETNHSFCYWQRTFNITTGTRAILQETGAKHLYIRYFDVDWSEQTQAPQPIGTLIANSPPPCRYTPVVFITNKVFEHISHTGIDSLAARISRRVEMINRKFIALALADSIKGNSTAPAISRQWDEILFDCDWTAGTSASYFYFLRSIQKFFPRKERAATLRLWQYKHRDISGIPPVNRCLLMCYNISDPTQIKTGNSIETPKELASYLTRSDYPHHIDIALPVFGWGVAFQRGKWLGLLSNIDRTTLQKDKRHFKEYKPNRFYLVKDTVIGKYYMRFGDEIRIEEPGTQELQCMINIIKKRVSLRNSSRLTFFSLDAQYINRYGTKEIRQFYSLFDREPTFPDPCFDYSLRGNGNSRHLQDDAIPSSYRNEFRTSDFQLHTSFICQRQTRS